jgi:glycosyltransferase involved in cell wall biosynthesis
LCIEQRQVIPTLNRARLIAGTLESAAKVLERGGSGEILVVDSSSNDETAAVFREFQARFPRCEWRYAHEPLPGLLSGRHRGAKEARGKILSYVDDDVLLSPTWLDGLEEAFADPAVALATGPTRPHYEADPPDWLEGLWQQWDDRRALFSLSLLDCGDEIRAEDPIFVLGHNLSMRSEAFFSCGGFHPDIGPPSLQRYQGDGETGLTLKARAANLRALYHPAVAVTHVIPAARLTRAYFERRAFYQGVCDSYTEVRAQGAARPLRAKDWKTPLRGLRSRFSAYRRAKRSEFEAVLVAMSRGFAWHQNEVRNDPSLLGWITKADYLDYALPEGWERYAIK